MSRLASVVVVAAVLFAGGSSSWAQQETFTDSTSVVVVEVPVNVVRDGRPVRGLTAQNFELYDGDELRPLIGFDVADLSLGPEARATASLPIAARRHVLLLFDLSFSSTESTARAVKASLTLLSEGLDPSDLVSVGIYAGSFGARLLVNFTPDHEQARETLGSLARLLDRDLGSLADRGAERDPLGLVAPDLRGLVAQLGRAAGAPESVVAESLRESGPGGGDRAAAIMAEILEEMAAAEGAALRQVRRTRIERMAGSLAALAQGTAGIEGRKHLLLFSGGFDPYAFEAGGSATLRELGKATEAFRRAGWTVHGVDVDRRTSTAPGEDGAAGLTFLARETGGETYRHFNDLEDAVGRLLDKTSVTYVLAFQVEGGGPEPVYHRLRVRLRDVPRGARVSHRAGYWWRPPSESAASELEIAQLLLSDQSREEIATTVLAVPFKGGRGKVRVSVVLQLDGDDLLLGNPGGSLTADVFAYAFATDGVIAAHFGQSFAIDLAERRELLASRGLKVVGDLELDPGRYMLRLLVRNPRSGRYTAKSVAVDVPGFEIGDAPLPSPVWPVRPLRP